ncbi:crystal protein-like [Clavelina lepadiformis]|uniref:crystal protein-like n=1 Tax=Clavelina lepadiformis TaxID=159417 RepID=UPI004043132B
MQLPPLLLLLPVLTLANQDPFFLGLEVALSKVIDGVKFSADHFVPKQTSTKRPDSTVIDNPEVTTTAGVITGATTSDGHAFYSIPYGEAPIAELRFKAPVPRADKGPINASVPDYVKCFEFPLDCIDDDNCDNNYSEDCLRLNVFIPPSVDFLLPSNEKLPVMVWLHGGAFFAGSGTSNVYDATRLSNQTNTVIVTVNYRLGPLGFLVYDENGTRLFEGNQGIKDQQLAMQWVQNNIEKFGGNKFMVTLFGESAGAQSVMYHLMSPVSEPLFHRVIMESNPASFPYPTQEEAINTVTKGLLRALNCTGSGLQCLMEASAFALLDSHIQTIMFSDNPDLFFVIEPYHPVLDGVEIMEQPLDFFQSGKWQNYKEVIIGVMKNEVAYVNAALKNVKLRKSMFERLITWVVGPDIGDKVIQKYLDLVGNPGPEYDYTDSLAQAAADLIFVCPTRALTRFMSKTSTLPKPSVYMYVDYHPLSGDACVLSPRLCSYAYHGLDVYYVFNVESRTGDVFAANDTAVADQFGKFWGNFAYYGAPSMELTEWPHYVPSSLNDLNINEWTNIRLEAPTSSTESDFRQDLCDFWDTLGFYVNFTSADETTKAKETTTNIEQTTTRIEDDAETTTTDAANVLIANYFVHILHVITCTSIVMFSCDNV